MDSGDCIRRHAGGADVDDGAVLSAEKSLVAIDLTRWGTVALRERMSRRVGAPLHGRAHSRLKYRADEREACP